MRGEMRCAGLVAPSSPRTSRASFSTVGASNIRRSVRLTSRSRLARVRACEASSECPPSRKKSAVTLTRRSPSTSAKMAASFCSVSSRGAT
ncbi:hypothetical protein COSO111634_37940 [Corallococcus soli]